MAESSTLRRRVRAGRKLADRNSPNKHILTGREREIVQLVAEGFHNSEIAEKLSISKFTVRNHLRKIFYRFTISNRLELVLYAFHHHWLDT